MLFVPPDCLQSRISRRARSNSREVCPALAEQRARCVESRYVGALGLCACALVSPWGPSPHASTVAARPLVRLGRGGGGQRLRLSRMLPGFPRPAFGWLEWVGVLPGTLEAGRTIAYPPPSRRCTAAQPCQTLRIALSFAPMLRTSLCSFAWLCGYMCVLCTCAHSARHACTVFGGFGRGLEGAS